MIKKIIQKALSFSLLVIFLFAAALVLLPWKGDIPVLMYHFVGSGPSTYENGNVVSEQSFRTQMKYLRFFGYRVISMDDYAAIKTGRQKPKGREVVLTFDDGDHSVPKIFFPVLQEMKFPATLFLISAKLPGGLNGSMTLEAAKRLSQSPLITMGDHSKTHPHLNEITETARLEDEIKGSKKDLEEMLGVSIRYFAYPSGEFNERSIRIVQEAGFQLAFTTGPKRLKGIREGLFSLTRVKMVESCQNPVQFLLRSSGIDQNLKRIQFACYEALSLNRRKL